MIRVVHPRSGSWFFTHPGSRIQGSKRHRIPDLDPQHCFFAHVAELFVIFSHVTQFWTRSELDSGMTREVPYLLQYYSVCLLMQCPGGTTWVARRTSGRWVCSSTLSSAASCPLTTKTSPPSTGNTYKIHRVGGPEPDFHGFAVHWDAGSESGFSCFYFLNRQTRSL